MLAGGGRGNGRVGFQTLFRHSRDLHQMKQGTVETFTFVVFCVVFLFSSLIWKQLYLLSILKPKMIKFIKLQHYLQKVVEDLSVCSFCWWQQWDSTTNRRCNLRCLEGLDLLSETFSWGSREKSNLVEAGWQYLCSYRSQNSKYLRPWQPRNEKLWYKKIQT